MPPQGDDREMPTAAHHAETQTRHWPTPKPKCLTKQRDIRSIRAAQGCEDCRRCPLWRNATQTVFGEGPEKAKAIRRRTARRPGGSGRQAVRRACRKVFDAVLDDAGVDRRNTYVTIAVNSSSSKPRGKRRIHSKPNAGNTGLPLVARQGIALTKPDLVVALGATAAQSLLGKAVPTPGCGANAIEREDGAASS